MSCDVGEVMERLESETARDCHGKGNKENERDVNRKDEVDMSVFVT